MAGIKHPSHGLIEASKRAKRNYFVFLKKKKELSAYEFASGSEFDLIAAPNKAKT